MDDYLWTNIASILLTMCFAVFFMRKMARNIIALSENNPVEDPLEKLRREIRQNDPRGIEAIKIEYDMKLSCARITNEQLTHRIDELQKERIDLLEEIIDLRKEAKQKI